MLFEIKNILHRYGVEIASFSFDGDKAFNGRVYYNHDLYQIGGIVRKFCSHAVYSKRCMTAYNKKWHTTKNLCDFDAVSLYPSDMSRLYTVKGKTVVYSKRWKLE